MKSLFLVCDVLGYVPPLLTVFRLVDVQEEVWGVAYKIPEAQESFVRQHLDFREAGGYAPVCVTFHPADRTQSSFELEIYVGTPSNPYFLGPAPLAEIARQIHESVGPSGRNDEYLFRLAEAMKIIAPGINDRHLFELENEVRKLNREHQHCFSAI